MAKNARISDTLYALAQAEALLQDRSIAQQLEHWAKLGMAAARRGTSAVGVVESAAEVTRRMDILDVRTGRRDPGALHFIPADVARAGKPAFPRAYAKS